MKHAFIIKMETTFVSNRTYAIVIPSLEGLMDSVSAGDNANFDISNFIKLAEIKGYYAKIIARTDNIKVC
jgi:hypothetical protein